MNPRHDISVCAIALFALILGGWLAGPSRAPRLYASPAARPGIGMEPAQSTPLAGPVPHETKPAPSMVWSRAEAVKYVRQYYAMEQLRIELALEQERYRGRYWEADPGWAELQKVEARRGEVIRELAVEMNELLVEICPNEPGEPLRLAPLFSLDRPAPNLAFLDATSRGKMEEALLMLADEGSLDAGGMMAVAGKILPAGELAEYIRWNAPAAASLRNRLAGFAADEDEFGVILQWQAAAGSGQEGGARTELERRLGPERLAQLEWLVGPEMSTAVQDLRRLGLPLDHAAWLADFRSQAGRDLQQLWDDPKTTDLQKQAQAGFLQDVLRVRLAAQLGSRAAVADLLP